MSQNATPATEFAACHHFAQRWQCDSQETRSTTRLKCCACQANWHWRSPKRCACHKKCNASSENVAKVLRLPHKNHFWHVMKHVGMSQSAMPATRNEARGKAPKGSPFAELPIGTAIVTSREWLRTVAEDCGRLRTVADGRLRTVGQRLANTAQPPHPQSETGTLATHSGQNWACFQNKKADILYMQIFFGYIYGHQSSGSSRNWDRFEYRMWKLKWSKGDATSWLEPQMAKKNKKCSQTINSCAWASCAWAKLNFPVETQEEMQLLEDLGMSNSER